MAEVRKYDAFISYRHSELDKFVATTLQRKLEAFTLPKGVSSKTKKKRIERVFRDQDELPLSSNLSEPIHLALNNTDFLIVICTPRLPESKWCEEEISTFIKLYGREKILAVLAEGEPSESFPPLLTGEDYEETLPDGTKVTKHRNFEPLAADVRGKNNKEVRKKLDDAVLRIAASIFELNYDDLKQRHRERKIRRMFSIISSVAAAFMIFSAICVGLMITIMNQSNMIMEQNTEIKEQSNEISQKNALINQQYEEAAENLSKLTATNSLELLKKGRKLDALYMLRQVIPDSSADTSIPYTPQAEEVLVDSLDVYSLVSEMKICNTYDSDYEIKSMAFSPDQTKILTLDSGNNIKIFEVESGRLLFSKQINSYVGREDRKVEFCGNDHILTAEPDGIHKYSIEDSKGILLDSPLESGKALEGSLVRSNNLAPNYSNYLVYDESDIFLLDNTGKTVFYSHLPDYFSNPSNLIVLDNYSVSNDGKYLALALQDYYDDTSMILVLDGETKDIVFQEKYDSSVLNEILFYDHSIYFCVSSSDLNDRDDSCSIVSLDCDSKKNNWKNNNCSFTNNTLVSTNGKYLYCAGYAYIATYDRATGESVCVGNIDETVTDIYTLVDSDYVFISTESGNNYIYSCESNTFYNSLSVNTYDSNTNKIAHTYALSDGLFVQFKNASYITRYENGKSAHLKEYFEKEDGFKSFNKAGDLYICSSDMMDFSIKSFETKETLFSVSNVSSSFSFMGDGDQYVIYTSLENHTTYIYDFKNEKTISLDGLNILSYSSDHIFGLSVDLDDHYKIYNLSTMEITCEFDLPDKYSGINYSKQPLGNNLLLIESNEYNSYEILQINDTSIDTIFYKYTGSSDYLIPCSGNSCFCIAYSTGMVEFYDYSTDKVELINTIFNISGVSFTSDFTYYKEKNIYTLSGLRSYILNEEFVSIARINTKIKYRPNDNLITFDSTKNKVYASPFYSYDELVKMADEELSGYCPPIRILQEYNIMPR